MWIGMMLACGEAEPEATTPTETTETTETTGTTGTIDTGPSPGTIDTAPTGTTSTPATGKVWTLRLDPSNYFWCGCGAACASGTWSCADGVAATDYGTALALDPASDVLTYDGVPYHRADGGAPAADACDSLLGAWESDEAIPCY